MKILLSSLAKELLNKQAKERQLTNFSREINCDVETLRKMKGAPMGQVERAQKIIEQHYKIVLIPLTQKDESFLSKHSQSELPPKEAA